MKLYLESKSKNQDYRNDGRFIDIQWELHDLKYKIFKLNATGTITTCTIEDIDRDPYLKSITYIDSHDCRHYSNPNEMFLTKAADLHRTYMERKEQMKKDNKILKGIFNIIHKEYPSKTSRLMYNQLHTIPKVLIPKKT